MLNRFVWFMAEVSLLSSLKSGDETSARRVHKGHESRFFGAICRSNADTLAFIELIFLSSRTNDENKNQADSFFICLPGICSLYKYALSKDFLNTEDT